MSQSIPSITIGLPVFNGEKHVRRAINSVLNQGFQNWTLQISDNNSEDGTPEICGEYANQDKRITITHQQSNIGAFNNYRELIKKAKTPFFVFIAADDYWDSNFLEETMKVLSENPSAVAATSRVLFIEGESILFEARGTESIQGKPAERLRKYLSAPFDNSRFYSLFRTEILRSAFFQTENTFHALDWYISAQTLLHGEHIRTENSLMWRSKTKTARYIEAADQENPSGLGRHLPIYSMSIAILKSTPVKIWARIIFPLLVLNTSKARERCKYLRRREQ